MRNRPHSRRHNVLCSHVYVRSCSCKDRWSFVRKLKTYSASFLILLCLCVSLFTLFVCRTTLFPNVHLVPILNNSVTPIPKVSLACLPLSTPTPSQAFSINERKYNAAVEHYCQLIQQKCYRKAYELLSIALRKHVSLLQFKNTASYVVSEKQWTLYQIVTSQPAKDIGSWIVGVTLKAITSPIAHIILYNWEIYLSMEHNYPAIVQIKLYPVG